MRERINVVPFEAWFTAVFVGFTLLVGQAAGLSFSLPSSGRAAFVGVHYLYPLMGLAIWAVVVARSRNQRPASIFLVALPCYALVLLAHFNLKLWVPDLNSSLFDAAYWSVDQALRPLVDWCIALRRALAWLIPLGSNFYMIGFTFLFYLSFTVHALGPRERYRALVIAAILFQALGALAYLVAPALGPFIYERGVEAMADQAQQSMLSTYRDHLAAGPTWLAANGGQGLTAGLAAMPSLHSGGSFLFLLFAARHDRRLAWIILPLWAFISIDAVANRWHYLIDLPAGMALAWLSVWIGETIAGAVRPQSGLPAPAPVLAEALQLQSAPH